MKLTSNERIILLIFIPIFVLALGFFLFIKPAIATNQKYKADLQTKLTEKAEVDQKIADAEGIEELINKTYDNCKKLSDYFYPEMDTYQVDQLINPICTKCNLKFKNLTLEYAEGEELEAYKYELMNTMYTLKDTVKINEGTLSSEETQEPEVTADTQAVADAINDTLAVTNVTVEVYYNSVDDVFKFADEIKGLDKAIIIREVGGKKQEEDSDESPTATITIKVFSIGEIEKPDI